MANTATTSAARQLGSLFEGGSATGFSDRQLIERFVAGRDSAAAEAAFAALVARHGPMVLRICRQLLGDVQHTEDAFQAVFLVLARKARSVRDPDHLGTWLYGVALRTARDARTRLARRRRIEEAHAMRRPEACSSSAAPADQAAIEREQAEALYGEVERLPMAFRLPVVLCYFEGLTLAEAALRLHCPPGTVHSRLDRAKEKLRRGLVRRGFALSTTAMAAALTPRSASAAIPPLLCDLTARGVIAFAAGPAAAAGALSAPAAALAQDVLRTMLIHKLGLKVVAVLGLAAVVSGAGYLTHVLAAARDEVGRRSPDPTHPVASRPVEQQAARTGRHAVDTKRPVTGRMTVTGRVIGPDGRPAAGVPVAVIGTSRRVPQGDADMGRAPYVALGQGAADGDGRFRIEAVRGSSARFFAVYALAGAAGPGSAFGCVKLHPDDGRPEAEIHLPPAQIIRGRLVDIHGLPAAGVGVHLAWVSGKSTLPMPDGGRFDSPLIPHGDSGRPPKFSELRPWPKPVVTDAQGRFTFTGVYRGLNVSLSILDPRFAPQEIAIRADNRDANEAAGREISVALYPPKTIEGRVLAADTGRPIPGAAVAVAASFGSGASIGVGMSTTLSRADDRGRFRINPHAGEYFRMRAIPSEGQPYLPGQADFAWTKGAVKKEIDLTLARGALIHGQVTELGTGRPVPDAVVQFIARRRPALRVSGDVRAGADGSFRVAVPPGEGYLMVLAPILDYVPEEITDGRLYEGGRPGGQRIYAHAIIPYKVEAGAAPREINPILKPGKIHRGRVLDPAGRPVADALILIRQRFDPDRLTWPGPDFLRAHDGHFELPGFDPEKATPAYFLDAEHEWGAAVELSGRQDGEDLVIRLGPCGRARVRFIGPDGRPVAGLNVVPYIELLMNPGATRIMIAGQAEHAAADTVFLSRVDFRHYPNGPSTDADGRVILPDLIPGATYRVLDYSTRNNFAKGMEIRKDFTVKPGETLDLGEILVEKPGAARLPTLIRPPAMKPPGAPQKLNDVEGQSRKG